MSKSHKLNVDIQSLPWQKHILSYVNFRFERLSMASFHPAIELAAQSRHELFALFALAAGLPLFFPTSVFIIDTSLPLS